MLIINTATDPTNGGYIFNVLSAHYTHSKFTFVHQLNTDLEKFSLVRFDFVAY